MPRTPRMKLASSVFKSKKVTKADAKKLKNLLKWRLNEDMKIRFSDNWYVLSFGVFIGFILGLMSNIGRP